MPKVTSERAAWLPELKISEVRSKARPSHPSQARGCLGGHLWVQGTPWEGEVDVARRPDLPRTVARVLGRILPRESFFPFKE